MIEHGLFELNEYDQGVNIWLGIIGRRPGEWCVASLIFNLFKVF